MGKIRVKFKKRRQDNNIRTLHLLNAEDLLAIKKDIIVNFKVGADIEALREYRKDRGQGVSPIEEISILTKNWLKTPFAMLRKWRTLKQINKLLAKKSEQRKRILEEKIQEKEVLLKKQENEIKLIEDYIFFSTEALDVQAMQNLENHQEFWDILERVKIREGLNKEERKDGQQDKEYTINELNKIKREKLNKIKKEFLDTYKELVIRKQKPLDILYAKESKRNELYMDITLLKEKLQRFDADFIDNQDITSSESASASEMLGPAQGYGKKERKKMSLGNKGEDIVKGSSVINKGTSEQAVAASSELGHSFSEPSIKAVEGGKSLDVFEPSPEYQFQKMQEALAGVNSNEDIVKGSRVINNGSSEQAVARDRSEASVESKATPQSEESYPESYIDQLLAPTELAGHKIDKKLTDELLSFYTEKRYVLAKRYLGSDQEFKDIRNRADIQGKLNEEQREDPQIKAQRNKDIGYVRAQLDLKKQSVLEEIRKGLNTRQPGEYQVSAPADLAKLGEVNAIETKPQPSGTIRGEKKSNRVYRMSRIVTTAGTRH